MLQSFSSGIVPHVPAGGLLLWDSRVLHCNTPGGEARGGGEGRAAEPELLRCAVMVRCCVDHLLVVDCVASNIHLPAGLCSSDVDLMAGLGRCACRRASWPHLP